MFRQIIQLLTQFDRGELNDEEAEASVIAELIGLIEDIQDELPCYGYRRVTRELCRRGRLVNHKRVARVMRTADLGTKPRKRYVRTTDSKRSCQSIRTSTEM